MAQAALLSVKSPEAFRTISEVAEMLGVPQHVLRFWETRFAHVKPVKRAGGRRFYRPEDVDLLRGIRTLLYFEGYTIKGVQKILREKGVRFTAEVGRNDAKTNGKAKARIAAVENVEDFDPPAVVSHAHDAAETPTPNEAQRARLDAILSELLALKSRLSALRIHD
ncbi:MAG TPA: MerR family transcriptional regulator [Rhizomicrobium sp.]|jgi:DNA-binding transcriptional MerR regulator